METSFTNAHSHIFTVNHAPDYFLKTGIGNTTLAEWVDKFLQNPKRPPENILLDLVIFDEKEASISNLSETKIYRRPSNKVDECIHIFKNQRNYCLKLEDVLKSSDTVLS